MFIDTDLSISAPNHRSSIAKDFSPTAGGSKWRVYIVAPQNEKPLLVPRVCGIGRGWGGAKQAPKQIVQQIPDRGPGWHGVRRCKRDKLIITLLVQVCNLDPFVITLDLLDDTLWFRLKKYQWWLVFLSRFSRCGWTFFLRSASLQQPNPAQSTHKGTAAEQRYRDSVFLSCPSHKSHES